MQIFVRPIMPTFHGVNSAAVAVMFWGTDGTPRKVSFTPNQFNLTHASGYVVSEAFTGAYVGT